MRAIPYDLPVVGYGNNVVDTLRSGTRKPSTISSWIPLIRAITTKRWSRRTWPGPSWRFFYPNDAHMAGKELRLKQQYFFISASVQTAIKKYKKHHSDIKKLYEKVTFQMNDTHPTVAVPELMRILMDEEGLTWDEAWEVTTKTCAYTNHTIMAEALEKWPIELFSRLLPRVYQIVEEINRRFLERVRSQYPGNEDKVRKMAVIYDGQVRMANLAIVGGLFRQRRGKASHRDPGEKGTERLLRDDAGEIQQQDQRHYPETVPASRQSPAGRLGNRSCGRGLDHGSVQDLRPGSLCR